MGGGLVAMLLYAEIGGARDVVVRSGHGQAAMAGGG
jgi:hypothetical protein